MKYHNRRVIEVAKLWAASIYKKHDNWNKKELLDGNHPDLSKEEVELLNAVEALPQEAG